MKTAQEIVHEMYSGDTYSQWLGITVISADLGACVLQMSIRPEMMNGHGIAHGGLSYAISDTALAFASNSRGQKCVSIETNIAHISPVHVNDLLIVRCKEISCGRSLGRYESLVTNQDGKLVARFNGTVYRMEETW